MPSGSPSQHRSREALYLWFAFRTPTAKSSSPLVVHCCIIYIKVFRNISYASYTQVCIVVGKTRVVLQAARHEPVWFLSVIIRLRNSFCLCSATSRSRPKRVGSGRTEWRSGGTPFSSVAEQSGRSRPKRVVSGGNKVAEWQRPSFTKYLCSDSHRPKTRKKGCKRTAVKMGNRIRNSGH